jgi:hypothetical protein
MPTVCVKITTVKTNTGNKVSEGIMSILYQQRYYWL